MTRLDDDVDEPTAQEMPEAIKRMPPEVLPLEYASRLRPASAPFDWPGAVRQVVFAAGLGFIAGALTDVWGGSNGAWKDNEVLWVGFGTAMVALTLSWPGRIGRKSKSL
jgi:hypothetical protein